MTVEELASLLRQLSPEHFDAVKETVEKAQVKSKPLKSDYTWRNKKMPPVKGGNYYYRKELL